MNRKPRNPQKGKHGHSRLFIVAGVVLLVTAVFLLKNQETAGKGSDYPTVAEQIPTAAMDSMTQPAPAIEPVQVSEAPTELPPTLAAQLLPEAQLDQHLAAGRPILAFFHSNTCVQCIRMTEIVEQVYPDYADQVALVDVNVYDERNQNLLGMAGIQVIPTLIFIDRDQQGQGHAGVMPPETLREHLEALAQEP